MYMQKQTWKQYNVAQSVFLTDIERKTTQEICSMTVKAVRAMSMHHNKAHKLPRFLTFFCSLRAISACFVTSLNKSSTFSLSLAEHSTYSTALSFSLASSPQPIYK